MYEIRIHGRGGQGAVLASKILAKALVEEGEFVKAIPSFGFAIPILSYALIRPFLALWTFSPA
jgi:hypothetical protein